MKYPIAWITLAAAAAISQGEVISQSVAFDMDLGGQILDIQRFDTMGGTRQLTGLSLSYDQSISYDITIESNGYTAVEAGDWEAWISYSSIHQFGLISDGRGGDDNDNNPPFIGPGAAGAFDMTSALGASDGFNGTGDDTYHKQVSEQFVFQSGYDTSTIFGQRMLDTFTGTDVLSTVFGGFVEGGGGWNVDPGWVVDPNNPPEGDFGPFEDPYYGFFMTFANFQHSGTITVDFEYTTVPAPSGLLVLSGVGLFGVRRRRA